MHEKKYKIVCLIHSLGHKGGMQRVAVNLANNWDDNGHTVEIWTLKDAKSFYQINANIRVINLSSESIDREGGKITKIINDLVKIIKIFLSINNLLALSKPNVLLIHRSGVRDSFVGFQRFYKNKTLELLHMQFQQEPGRFSRHIELLQSMIFKLFQPKRNLVVLNNATKQEAISNGWKNVIQIPNAVPFRSQHKSSCQNPYIIAIARDDPKKGLDVLIKAFAIVSNKHNNWQLRIIGEGITNPSNNVNKLIREHQLEAQIILLEPVPNIQEYYLESSIYVLSSYTEGMPMVLLEAMECGLPIISSDLNGINDVISSDCSLKFKIGDYKELALRLDSLIEDEGLRKQMGRASTRHVTQFYINEVDQSWLNLFEKIDNRSI